VTAYLILDTNALPVLGSFTSGFWVALFHLCTAKGIEPAISEVALEESVNLRRVTAEEAVEAVLSAVNQLSKLTTIAPIYAPSGEEIAKSHEEQLKALFEILPLSGDHAREALRREARRILPAREGRGARDSAIWLTVAALVNDGHEVHFVSNNSKDFGKGEIHPQMLAEVEKAQQPIKYYSSPNDFLAAIATRIDRPEFEPGGLATVFGESLRSELIAVLENVEWAGYTVDRALQADIAISNMHLSHVYSVDGQGLALLTAIATLSDPGGLAWASGSFTAWLNFDPATQSPLPSEVEKFDVSIR
jgi:hypothetical protein